MDLFVNYYILLYVKYCVINKYLKKVLNICKKNNKLYMIFINNRIIENLNLI